MSTYTDASLIYYPSGYKAGTAYSLKPTDGSGDLTFTRASTATRVNESGLIEGVRTNLALYSNDLSNAVWIKTFTTITSNAAISPDGTTNANKIVETTDNNLHRAGQGAIAVTSGQVYTFSFYAKAGERSELELQRINTSGTVFNSISATTADLTLGTLSVGSNLTSSSINSVGDGWYRISLSLTAIATGSGGLNIGMQKDGNVSYLGDGTSGVFIYRFQAEQSASATEYIPTTTTAVSVGMLANVPRIDYTGGGCSTLLLEPQRTNLIAYSEDFSNAYWTKNGASVTSGFTSPDGTTNAFKLVEDTSTGSHYLFKNIGSADGSTNTASVFAKKGERTSITLYSGANFTDSSTFNLENGTSVDNGTSTSKIQLISNGWYKCSVTSVNKIVRTYIMINNGTTSYTGDGTSGVYIFGASLEAGSYPTSYIPTLGTAVTRVKDETSTTIIPTMTGVSEFTWFFDNTDMDVLVSVVVYMQLNLSGGALRYYSTNGGRFRGSTYFGDVNAIGKLAVKCDGTTLSMFKNGVKSASTLASALGTFVNFSGFNQGGESFSGGMQSMILFPTALSDAEIIALTTI